MTADTAQVNRPDGWGPDNQRTLNYQTSEVSLVALNDSNGNPVFLGRAKTGTGLDEEKWQIRKITYDSNQGVTRVEWPENSRGANSENFEFFWNNENSATVTGITNANPGVVTTSAAHNFTNGDKVYFQDVVGMTEVNFDGTDNIYTVANVAATTFELSGTDTTAFTAYSSGGTVSDADVVNYTYG